MRIALVLEHADGRPWDHSGPWGAALSRALAARGHEVTVYADGVTDAHVFGGARVELRRPFRRSMEADPLGFACWADRRAAGHGGVSLSLARTWAGDVWVPMGRSAKDEAKRLIGVAWRPAAFGMQAIQRLWLPGALAAEKLARWRAKERGSTVASIGEPVFRGVRTVGPTSPALVGERGAVDGGRVRRTLGLGADDLVLLASAVHHADAGFSQFLIAAGAFAVEFERSSGRRLRVVVVGGRPHLVARRAERAWAERVVMPLGQTRRMDALMAASDAVVAVGGMREVDGRPRGTGRLVAEAVCAGVPVVLNATAAGVTAARGSGWGHVVRGGAWEAALRVAVDDAWRVRARAAALADRDRFGFERVVEALEGALERAGAGAGLGG